MMCDQEKDKDDQGFDSERNSVECQICFCQVVHDRLELEKHMEKVHCGFGLRHYFEFFVHSATSAKLLGSKRPKLVLSRCSEPLAQRKTGQNDDDEFISEAEILLRQAPRSEEVLNMCAFKCPHCKNRFNSWPAIYTHNRSKKHGCRGINGGYTKWEEVAIQVGTHECQVCGHLLPCDKDKVACHLTRHHHGLRAHEYRAYIEEKKRPGSKIDLKQFLKKLRNKEKEVKKEKNRIEVKVPVVSRDDIGKDGFLVPFSNMVKKESVTMRVGNMCRFSCTRCPFETDALPKMMIHWRKKCPAAEKPSRDPSCVKVAKVHMCHLCGERVLCDRNLITAHIQYAHRITIGNYTTLTEKNLGTMSEEVLKEAVEKHYDELNDKDECNFNNQQDMRSTVPAVIPPLEDFVIMPAGSLPGNKTTLLFENLCTFTCPKCFSNFYGYNRFHLHVAQNRCCPITGREIDYYISNPRGKDLRLSHVKRARYHFCHVCGKSVLCDRSIIEGHFRSHKLTKENYLGLVDTNIKKNDGAIFPLPQEVVEKKSIDSDQRHAKKPSIQNPLRTAIPVVVPPLPDFVVMPAGSLPRAKTTLLFESLCTFTCLECSSDFVEYRKFCFHVVQSRCRPITGKEIQYLNYKIINSGGMDLVPAQVTEARYHFCNVCSRCVLCDQFIIEDHFRSHRLNRGHYIKLVEKNIQKGGGAIFPPPQEGVANQ